MGIIVMLFQLFIRDLMATTGMTLWLIFHLDFEFSPYILFLTSFLLLQRSQITDGGGDYVLICRETAYYIAILSNTQIFVQTRIMGWAFNDYECCQNRISSIVKLNAKSVLCPVTKEPFILKLKHNCEYKVGKILSVPFNPGFL